MRNRRRPSNERRDARGDRQVPPPVRGALDTSPRSWREAVERDPWLWNGWGAYVACVLEARYLLPIAFWRFVARVRRRRHA